MGREWGALGRVDRLESIDVDWGIGRWGDVDESLPEGVETEEESDGFRAGEGRHWAESALAMRVLEGIDGPDGFDEVAPERAHGAGGGFFGWRDKEDLGRRLATDSERWPMPRNRQNTETACGGHRLIGARSRLKRFWR